MSSLREVVETLQRRPGVSGVAVVSGDGLIIEQALAVGGPTDSEALAALAVTLVRHSTQLAETSHQGSLHTAVFEFAEGAAIIQPLSPAASLIILGSAPTDLGPLLYDLRRHRQAIAALL